MPLNRSEIVASRLRNQRISAPTPGTPGKIVAWLGAVQAQDYAGARWSVGLRLQGLGASAVDQALAEGSILRTHVLRPTWHFVTPDDIRWMLMLTAPRVGAINATMHRKTGLDAETFKRSNAVLAEALQGGNQLTRDELRDSLERAGVVTGDGLRLSYLMMQAELDGLICSGGRRGKQFTYALLEERAPNARRLERDEALAELAGRYFRSRGPATVQDFAKWSGLTVGEAASGLGAVKDQFHCETFEGREHWFEPPLVQSAASPVIYLLSIYDEYISGYKDRSAIGEAEFGPRLFEMGSALAYIIVLDGQIVGTWRRDIQKNAILIKTDLFITLDEAQQQALALAAEQYGQFHRLPVALA